MRIFNGALLFWVSVFLGGCFLHAEKETDSAESGLVDAEIVTVGIDHNTGSPIVLLRELGGGGVIPIWIGLAEAQSIIQALHDIELPRPMTHDLTINLLFAAGVEMEELVVHDLRNGVFYGTIYLRVPGEEELVAVDSRPSDGMALAVRSNARIRVAEKILMETPAIDFVPPTDDQVVQVFGLTVVTATEALREELGLAEQVGLIINGVQDPAAERGFRRGDLIFRVNDIAPQTPMEFLEEVMRTEAGREPEVHFWRDGEERQLKLPAATPPSRTISI